MHVNKTLCEAIGKTPEEVEGKSCFDIFPKEQADAYWKDDQEVISTGIAKKNIIEWSDTVRGKRCVQTDKIPFKTESGDIIGVIGFSIDITDRIDAEKAQDKTEIMLQQIIDLLPIRIFWKDINLNFLGCNKALARDAGKNSVSEIIGKTDYDFSWKEQAELYRKDDQMVIQSKTAKLDYEEPQTTPDGKTVWLQTNKVPLYNKSGEVVGVLGTYFNITDRKQSEAALKSALEETKKMNDLMIGRELKMVEMKQKIENLENQIKELTQKLE